MLHIIYDTCTWIKTKRHYTRFQKEYYAFTPTRFGRLSELANTDFDAIIVGSDQIWNPEITNGCLDRFYTLDFKSDRIRKISYAASFSQSHITQKDTFILIERLKMSEAEAHRYIEKQAMDTCTKRRIIAEKIIRTYEN